MCCTPYEQTKRIKDLADLACLVWISIHRIPISIGCLHHKVVALQNNFVATLLSGQNEAKPQGLSIGAKQSFSR
jgi:hypothetical protein